MFNSGYFFKNQAQHKFHFLCKPLIFCLHSAPNFIVQMKKILCIFFLSISLSKNTMYQDKEYIWKLTHLFMLSICRNAGTMGLIFKYYRIFEGHLCSCLCVKSHDNPLELDTYITLLDLGITIAVLSCKCFTSSI